MEEHDFKLSILGCGEAFEADLGNNSALLWRDETPYILFDCGYQIPERLFRIGKLHQLKAIYLTHFHMDHAFGMAPLLIKMHDEGRRSPITLMGPEGLKAFTKKLLNFAFPGSFEKLGFKFKFVELKKGMKWKFDGQRFSCAQSNHGVTNLSVKVVLTNGKSFGISGDGAINKETKELLRNTNHVLHEVYALEDGGKGHNNLMATLQWIKFTNIRHFYVTHISRFERQKVQNYLDGFQEKGPNIKIASPGLEITL